MSDDLINHLRSQAGKTIITIFLAVLLAACGGGGDDGSGGAVMKPNATAGGQVVYRACETTGPEAPPCPTATPMVK